MENIDSELARPFIEALDVELRRHLAACYPQNMAMGAASYSVQSSGKEVGGDIELKVIIAARWV